jgi:hypothetical protein
MCGVRIVTISSTEATLREAEGGEEGLWGSPWPARPGVPDSNPTYPPRNGAVFADGISSRMTDAAPRIGP